VSARWTVVALLWVVALLNYLDRQVIFSLFPLLEKDLQLTSFQLGLLSTAFLWIYAAASPFAGFLADRYGRKRVVVVSLVLRA
jgi:MFS family permease